MGKIRCVQTGCGGRGKIGSGIVNWEGGGGCLNQDLRDLGISRIADWLRVDKRCRCGGCVSKTA